MQTRHTLILTLAALLGVSAAPETKAVDAQFNPLSNCGPRIHVTFNPGFPDTFVVENNSSEGWTIEKLSIEVDSSYGDVVFDTVPGSVSRKRPNAYYVIKTENGDVKFASKRPVIGDRKSIVITFDAFPSKSAINIDIDMDDTARVSSRGPHRVTFGELAGTKVIARMKRGKGYRAHVEARFGQTGEADSEDTSALGSCI